MQLRAAELLAAAHVGELRVMEGADAEHEVRREEDLARLRRHLPLGGDVVVLAGDGLGPEAAVLRDAVLLRAALEVTQNLCLRREVPRPIGVLRERK